MENIQLYNEDCLNVIKEISNKSIDVIITDPPYKVITGGKNSKIGTPSGILTKNKQLMQNIPKFDDWLLECYRILKLETHAYFMTNMMNLKDMMISVERAGFYIHNILVWEKNTCTPNKWYMKNCEYTIFAKKGKSKFINNCSSKTVVQFNNPTSKLHPTEKPVGLMEMYIKNSSNKGELVLDPFMGSGTTGVACKNLNRNFIGIELNKDYFKIAKDRIKNRNTNQLMEYFK